MGGRNASVIVRLSFSRGGRFPGEVPGGPVILESGEAIAIRLSHRRSPAPVRPLPFDPSRSTPRAERGWDVSSKAAARAGDHGAGPAPDEPDATPPAGRIRYPAEPRESARTVCFHSISLLDVGHSGSDARPSAMTGIFWYIMVRVYWAPVNLAFK